MFLFMLSGSGNTIRSDMKELLLFSTGTLVQLLELLLQYVLD